MLAVFLVLLALCFIPTQHGFTPTSFVSRSHPRVRTLHVHQKESGEVSVSTRADADTKARKSLNSIRPTRQSNTRRPEDGLSKFHRQLLISSRQRFVTGRYPLFVSVRDSPTRRWLWQSKKRALTKISTEMTEASVAPATSQLYVNGTSVEKSTASVERISWFDDDEEDGKSHTDTHNNSHNRYASSANTAFTMELIAEICVKRPGYVRILPTSAGGMHHHQNHNQRSKSSNKSNTNSESKSKEVLWITDFSIAAPGGITSVDIFSGNVKSTASTLSWPNEVASVPAHASQSKLGESQNQKRKHQQGFENALLVTDGFLVPGRDNGGVYVIQNPGCLSEWKVCLAGGPGAVRAQDRGWFYHRAVWMDLTGDGRQSILAARARSPSFLNTRDRRRNKKSNTNLSQLPNEDVNGGANANAMGQLVWLERPQAPRYDEETGVSLDIDGTVFDPFSARNTPWKLRVLDVGPDVMFSVADLDAKDNSVEVIASQFFSRKVSLHSIERGLNPRVSFSRILDEDCGASFSAVLADLDGNSASAEGVVQDQSSKAGFEVVDCGSTIKTLTPGDKCSHVLVTSHECKSAEPSSSTTFHNRQAATFGIHTSTTLQHANVNTQYVDGGSLFAYRIPKKWRTAPWTRSVVATGFRVRGQLGNMINPGAPGFCYTFFATKEEQEEKRTRPLIGISGDCAEAAYILRPVVVNRDEGETETTEQNTTNANQHDASTDYALMCEIECGATVGSLAIGYENFCSDFLEKEEEGRVHDSGYAKLYIPSYEKDKIQVFAMSDGGKG